MYSFSWVVEGKLAGLARPYHAEDFSLLNEKGIRVLINLTGYSSDSYKLNAKKLRLEMIDIAIPDFHPPTTAEADSFVSAVESAFAEHKPVAVHCQMGHGRTGTMLAYYFMKVDGLSADEAIKKVRELRPGSIETDIQIKFLISCQK